VSNMSRIYVINQNTGAAHAIGTGPFTPAVQGTLVGFDFNPTVDRIRLVTSTGQNLRLNPETGTVAATDGVLNGAAGATITGSAYTNNTAGASTTVLYDLDPASDRLLRQDPPNDGTLVPVGALNLNITGEGGFDIDAKTGTALGLYAVNGKPTLFAVNLSTGAARPLAEYAANSAYSGLAIPTQPVVYVAASSTAAGQITHSLLISDPTSSVAAVQKPITGVTAGQVLLGIDFRPANGQLYAVGRSPEVDGQPRNSQLYTLNAATGAATPIGSLSIPGIVTTNVIGVDFNPVTDRLMIVGDPNNLIYEVNPTTGATTMGTGDVSTGTKVVPTIYAVAYDNNYAGATTTSLYFADILSGGIYSNGTLITRASLSTLDIGGTSNLGYSVQASNVITINLSTGEIKTFGTLRLPEGSTAPTNIRGLTVGLGF
jgi:hypothetical protein